MVGPGTAVAIVHTPSDVVGVAVGVGNDVGQGVVAEPAAPGRDCSEAVGGVDVVLLERTSLHSVDNTVAVDRLIAGVEVGVAHLVHDEVIHLVGRSSEVEGVVAAVVVRNEGAIVHSDACAAVREDRLVEGMAVKVQAGAVQTVNLEFEMTGLVIGADDVTVVISGNEDTYVAIEISHGVSPFK